LKRSLWNKLYQAGSQIPRTDNRITIMTDQPKKPTQGNRPNDTMVGRPIPRSAPINQPLPTTPQSVTTQAAATTPSIERATKIHDKAKSTQDRAYQPEQRSSQTSDKTSEAPDPSIEIHRTSSQEQQPQRQAVAYGDESDTQATYSIKATRPKDNGIGRPIPRQAPEGGATSEDDLSSRSSDSSLEQSATESIFEDNKVTIPRFWFESGFLLVVVFFAGFVGLLAYSHTLSILADLASLPKPLQLLGYGFLALVLAAVIAGIFHLVLTYTRLAKHRQIVIRQIRKISDSSSQKDKTYRVAKNYLSMVLSDYPSPEQLKGFGLDEGTSGKLTKAIKRLKQDRAISSKEWLDEFQTKFQSILDKAARERVHQYSLRVGIKTTLSPYPLLDMMAMLYNSSRLFSDLAKIYNRRMSRMDSICVFAWILINTYISGEIQDPAEGIVETFTEQLGRSVPGLAKAATGKILEGTANYILTRRLGNLIVGHLQHVQE
jgi:uncharacterized membrane protein YcjF (UPF0283 family)